MIPLRRHRGWRPGVGPSAEAEADLLSNPSQPPRRATHVRRRAQYSLPSTSPAQPSSSSTTHQAYHPISNLGMSGSDGLLLLRSALSASAPLDLLQFPTAAPSPLDLSQATKVHALADATHIQFPSPTPTILPKSTPTRWQVAAGEDPNAATYPLDALLFAFLHRDDSVAEYIKASRDAGVEFVTVTDRRLVLDWLSGKSGIEGPAGRIRAVVEEGGISLKRAGEGGVGGGEGVDGSSAEFGLPVGKKGRYAPDRVDLDKLKRMSAIIDGPVYANLLPTGIDNKGIKTGGLHKTRETVLTGDRINVSRSPHHRNSRSRSGPQLTMAPHPIGANLEL